MKLLLDSLQNHYGKEFDFNDIHIQKVRWGIAGYVDGKAKEADMFIRLYTLVNINSHIILWYLQKGDSQEKFTDEANAIAGESVEIWRSYLASKAGEITETKVVGDDD